MPRGDTSEVRCAGLAYQRFIMPYKDKNKDRQWHKLKMRERRVIIKLNSRFVTPTVTPKVDVDGNVIPKYE